MPVNWTSGKRHAAQTKYRSGTSRVKPKKTNSASKPQGAFKQTDEPASLKKLFNFTFAVSPKRPFAKTGEVHYEEEIISQPIEEVDSHSAFVVRPRTPIARTTTRAEKKAILLKMDNWTWLPSSDQARTDDDYQELSSSESLSTKPNEQAKTDFEPLRLPSLAIAQDTNHRHRAGRKGLHPLPSPPQTQTRCHKDWASSMTKLAKQPHNTADHDSIRKTSLERGKPGFMYQRVHEAEPTSQLVSTTPAKVHKNKTRNARLFDRSDSPEAGHERFSPSPTYNLHTLPTLTQAVCSGRLKHARAPSDDLKEGRVASRSMSRQKIACEHPGFSSETSSADAFSDLLAAVSCHPKQKSNITSQRLFPTTSNDPEIGTKSKGESLKGKIFDFTTGSDSGSSETLRSPSNTSLSLSHHSTSYRSKYEELDEDEKSSLLLEDDNNTTIIHPGSIRSSTSSGRAEEIIEFSDPDIDRPFFTDPEDIRLPSPGSSTAHDQPESSRAECGGLASGEDADESEVPEWIKRISSSMGFSPPKMSGFVKYFEGR
ncbi:hypothetical protein CROQUDRAFT_657768 [Cronartium quercuum f. sp. fusiforme G11]|uniref:Uncharacterized protein n=1 Tax=Cronartium quercuum f. sp. fusiforme G11 TaxID=708437 RepID=A0A9P6TBC7_9BASI|nr:hypothetical protein CROQUDRAFT_657768 [Cronartium quercuum f. sp. fusiforme G11]